MIVATSRPGEAAASCDLRVGDVPPVRDELVDRAARRARARLERWRPARDALGDHRGVHGRLDDEQAHVGVARIQSTCSADEVS